MRADGLSGNHVLIADDDPDVVRVLGLLLEAEGLRVTLARDGQEALDLFARHPPDLLLLDLEMPRVGGLEVCRLVKSDPARRFVPVAIITGQGDTVARLRAWEVGADEFLAKPFQGVEVVARCHSLLRLKGLVDELDSAQSVVFALARATEAKSRYTQGHSERVTAFALALAGRLGLPAGQRELLRAGGLLHDLGKIGVPDAILNKPGPLTPEEYAVVQRHPADGARIAEPLRSIRDAIPLIRWHHERPDGRGYPDGLSGEAIPLLVRVLSVADVYDALASERPYRPARPLPECLEVLRSTAAGGGLDPELVTRFCAPPAVPLLVPAPRPNGAGG